MDLVKPSFTHSSNSSHNLYNGILPTGLKKAS